MDGWIRLRGIGWDWLDEYGLVWMVTPSHSLLVEKLWIEACELVSFVDSGIRR